MPGWSSSMPATPPTAARRFSRATAWSARRAARDGWRLDVERADGSTGNFLARALVNAAGPAALDLLPLTGVRSDQHVGKVRGSHIVVPRLFDHDFAYFFQLPDRRIFFAIPYERNSR